MYNKSERIYFETLDRIQIAIVYKLFVSLHKSIIAKNVSQSFGDNLSNEGYSSADFLLDDHKFKGVH